MKKMFLTLLVLCAPLLGSATQLEDDAPIDMELRQAPLVEVLRSFAQISGSELVLDGSIAGSVTIDLEQVAWRQALGTICEQHELSCELLQGARPVLRVRPATGDGARPPGLGELVDMSLKSADLRETLSTFGLILGREVILDPEVNGQVTIHLAGVPLPVLMEEICALSGCRIEWGETIRVLPVTEETRGAGHGDLVLAGASLDEALATALALPVFGRFGPPALDTEPTAGGIDTEPAAGGSDTLDLDLRDAPWPQILNAICDPLGYHWTMRYGTPSRLEVRSADPRLTREVVLEGGETTLESAAAELAAIHGLEARLAADLDPRAPIRLSTGPMPWRKAMYVVCRSIACSWTIEDRELVLASRVEPLASHPISETSGVDLAVRFSTAGVAGVDGTARFTWTTPLYNLAARGDDPWQLRLAWIPFRPDLHVVLPILTRCAGETIRDLEVLSPARLPLAGPWSERRNGMSLELAPAADGGDSSPTQPSAACLRRATDELEAVFWPAAAAGETERTRAVLANRPGAYLLVTPPGIGPVPLAAIVALGGHGEGRQRVALVAPRGSEVEIEHRTLARDDKLRETLSTADGRTFELELSGG